MKTEWDYTDLAEAKSSLCWVRMQTNAPIRPIEIPIIFLAPAFSL